MPDPTAIDPLATDPAVETTIINQVGASPEGPGLGGGPIVAGIPSPPVADPVIYVIGADHGSRRAGGRKYARARPGPQMVSMRPHGVGQLQPHARPATEPDLASFTSRRPPAGEDRHPPRGGSGRKERSRR